MPNLQKQLEELEKKPFLTPQDEMEIKILKKKKLAYKDQMEKILMNTDEETKTRNSKSRRMQMVEKSRSGTAQSRVRTIDQGFLHNDVMNGFVRFIRHCQINDQHDFD